MYRERVEGINREERRSRCARNLYGGSVNEFNGAALEKMLCPAGEEAMQLTMIKNKCIH